jgi:hypothetical protein
VAEIGSAQADAAEGPGTASSGLAATGFLQRAVIRRRVRFLRRRRELALHDLGGFVFESHRLGEPGEAPLAEKLASLSALDGELATLQRALELREELAVLHEPGINSCPQCSTIHDSAANFCPTCGRPTAGEGPAATTAASEGEPPTQGEPPAQGARPGEGEPGEGAPGSGEPG